MADLAEFVAEVGLRVRVACARARAAVHAQEDARRPAAGTLLRGQGATNPIASLHADTVESFPVFVRQQTP